MSLFLGGQLILASSACGLQALFINALPKKIVCQVGEYNLRYIYSVFALETKGEIALLTVKFLFRECFLDVKSFMPSFKWLLLLVSVIH